ncbi:hypothetical protein BCR36DRAFT_398517 [Piromyces finnis]|uniref:Uncharacterized protein n=1 Tax=Piromyces finnis TaxID=1754191 RepID=A0A1Y1V4R9_9FUNG|nr:hypothetical protein BCR36DRAFT_398517 [Piromyces finnis]|eukprot:ORX47306.1 hypothetical protein BCR36DRAFT_398517 [Piromyces finnis]
MLKVENINSILISYSTISKCNPKLVVSLNKIFKPVLTSKDNNENFKILAFQYAPIAMKIFNQIIKTLSEINNEISNSKKRKFNFIDLSDDTYENLNKKQKSNINQMKDKNDEIIIIDEEPVLINDNKDYTSEKLSLIESSKITLEVLERLEIYLNIKPIDIDLAHSNLITKLIEIQMIESAEIQLKHLYERIQSRYFENEMKCSYNEIIQLHKKILIIPIINNKEDLNKFSQLIITTQLNCIKCLSYRNNLDFMFNERNFTLYKHCNFVREKNKLLSEKLYSNICRVLLKEISEKYKDRNPEISFKIQFVALEAMRKTGGSTINWYIDAILKYAYTFEQKMKTESNLIPIVNTISKFYEKAFSFISDNDIIQLNLSKKLITLLDHYLYLGKKIKNPTIVINSREILFRILKVLKKNNKIQDYTFYTTKFLADLDINHLLFYDIFIYIDKSKFYHESYQYVEKQLDFIELTKQAFSSSINIPAIENDNTQQIINSIETFIKIINQNLYLFNSKKTSTLLTKQRKSLINLFEKIISLLNFLLLKKLYQHKKELVSIIIKCETLLSNLCFIFEDYNTWLYIDNYLEAAKELAEKYSCINGFKEISKAYSNIAIKLYKNKYYKESISLFDFSYKTLLKVKDQSLELANILDMLAICYYYIHEKETARNTLIESFKRIPLDEYKKFNYSDSKSSNDIIKIIEHYVRFSISMIDTHPYLFLDEILSNNLYNKKEFESYILNILKYELQTLEAIENKHNTENEQFKSIDYILKYYDENLYPFTYSKFQLKKLHLYKVLKPQNVNDHLNLCQSIINLLKKDDYKNDSNKINQRNNYLSISYSIYGIIMNKLKDKQIKYFKTALKTWDKLFSSLLKYKQDREIIDCYIDNIEQTYLYIDYLADYFDIFGNFKYKIITLRVLSLLNELTNKNKKYEDDKVKILINISQTYLKMGYSKQAIEELDQLKELTVSSSQYSWLCYHLYLSYYYVSINELEKWYYYC